MTDKQLKIAKQIFIFILSCMNCCYAGTSKQIQNLLDHFRQESQAPAAVLSIRLPENKISNYVSGTIEKIKPKHPLPSKITTQHLFQIGSLTKSFTAVIILQLEAEGKLSINDTLSDITQKYGHWLTQAEYDAWKQISIKQLLNMTSGIFDVTEDKAFMNMLARHPEKHWKTQEILNYASRHKLYFLPGTGWHYTNTAYNLLGMLIEVVTQNSFENEINHRLLKKYHLKDTFYLPYRYPDIIFKRMAHGYVYKGGEFSPPMQSDSDMTRANMSAAGPSGALVSNSIDITQWIQLIFSNKILPPSQMKELLSAVCTGEDKSCRAGEELSPESHSQGFALGLTRLYDLQLGILWVYFGDTPGYSSGFMWIPDQKIGLAMTLSATSKNSKKLLKKLSEIAKLILENSVSETAP